MTLTNAGRGGVVWVRGMGCLAFAAVTLAVLPGHAAAQMQSDSLTITLDEAISMARRANPAFRRAENALDQNAAERRNTLFSQVLPTVRLDLLSTGYSGNLSYRARDNFGNPIANPDAEWSYFSSTNQGLDLSWTFRGRSLFNTLRGQDLQESSRIAAMGTAAWSLSSDVRTQYYSALQALGLLEVEEELAAGRAFDLESANRRFELAQASRVDVLTAEVQVEQQNISVREARSRYEQALLSLRTAIGDPDAPSLRVSSPELPIFDPSSITADALVGRALGSNPGLAESEFQIAQARLGVDQAGGERWWPQISLNYSIGRFSQAPEVASFGDFTHEKTDLTSRFGFSVSLPFFNNYFQDDLNEVQAQIQLANAQESRKENELNIDQSVRSGLIDLKNQYASLQLAQRSADIAGEASELARQEYQFGIRTFEQLQQTLQQESDARRSVIQSRFGFVTALLTLESAIGAPITLGAN